MLIYLFFKLTAHPRNLENFPTKKTTLLVCNVSNIVNIYCTNDVPMLGELCIGTIPCQ